MLRSLAEDHLKFWNDGDSKVYRYSREFVPPEYVVYKKEITKEEPPESKYKFVQDKSTYQLEDLTEEAFIKKLASGELIFEKDVGWGVDTKKMKTGGCNCGAWILKENVPLHDDKCPLYKGKNK